MARKPKIIPRKKPATPKAPKAPKAEVVETQGAPDVAKSPPASDAPSVPDPAAARNREAARVFAYATNLHRQGDNEQAVEAYSRALTLAPGNAGIYSNMGICLRAQGKLSAAATCYRRALVLSPDDVGILSNLGNVLRDMNDLQAAINCLGKALKANPGSLQALYNIALALRDVGQVDKAIQCLENALAHNQDDIGCHVELGFALLMKGALERGFTELEWRLKLPAFQAQMSDALLWDGQPLAGKTILIHQDGGLSDLIQFARYIHIVKERGANVVVECHAKSAPLLATVQGVDKICIAGNQRPDFDVHAPIMSLPYILGIGDQTFAEQVPYVGLPDARSIKLPLTSGMQITTGLCWSPDVVRSGAGDRSVPLDKLMKLLSVPGIMTFSLQGGERAGDLKTVSCPALITDLGSRIKDLADLASVISRLDLVICVDSITAHVAAALGKPTWVLLPFVCDWRWHPKGETSVWYPSMRLFHQPRPDDWASVIEDVHQALFQRATRKLDA